MHPTAQAPSANPQAEQGSSGYSTAPESAGSSAAVGSPRASTRRPDHATRIHAVLQARLIALLLRSVRIQPKLNDVPQGTRRSRGGLTSTRPPHTLGHHLRVEQCAVPLCPGCRATLFCLLHLRISAALNHLPPCCLPHCQCCLVPHKVPTQQQCAEVSEPRASAPSVCREQISQT